MKNVVLTGIGGQGTVLAAKILAQAAQARGWHVRTAETIGMAQRGGSVVSHVRMGDAGEQVASPLVPRAQADMLIAFEPGEGVRMAGVLKPGGAMVTASRVVQPVTASLSREPYEAQAVLDALRAKACETIQVSRQVRDEAPQGAVAADVSNAPASRVSSDEGAFDATADDFSHEALSQSTSTPIGALCVVDEAPILARIGNAKALNIVLLTVAVHAGALGLTVQEFKDAVAACVKPRFRDMNLAAIDAVEQLLA